MAHNLEQSGQEVAFSLRGKPAWHGLANRIFDEDEEITTAEMLSSAKLNGWGVSLEPALYPDGYRHLGNTFMVTRTNPFDGGKDVLAMVGARYKVFQNENLFDFGDNILDGGARWESAGSIQDGRTVFGSLVVPREHIIDPTGIADKVKTYLLVKTSHDGSASVQACITPVRVVCQNTMNMALSGAKQSFKIRHSTSVAGRIDEARRVLGLTFSHMDKFDQMATALFESKLDAVQFNSLMLKAYPKPESGSTKQVVTKWDNKVILLGDIYANSPTSAGVTGTAWGALNAFTERLDYFRVGRKANGEALIGAASGFDPSVNAEKARLLGVVREFAGV